MNLRDMKVVLHLSNSNRLFIDTTLSKFEQNRSDVSFDDFCEIVEKSRIDLCQIITYLNNPIGKKEIKSVYILRSSWKMVKVHILSKFDDKNEAFGKLSRC